MGTYSKTATIHTEEHLDYNLTIRIGDGQQGSSAFNKPDGTNVHGSDFENEPLAKGSALRGKSLWIDSLIVDINPHTNSTTLIIEVNGQEFVRYEEETDKPNGTNWFETELKFV